MSGNYPFSFFLKPTDATELHNIIMALKSSNSAGEDEIRSKILKSITKEIIEPLTHSINLSLLTGTVHKMTKIAKIIPILKSGDKHDITNYRPISILPTLSKILERVVYNRLIIYLNTLYILSMFQYGFRKKTHHLFFKLRHLLPHAILLTLYKTLFEPHLNYCNIIWCNTYPTHLIKIRNSTKKNHSHHIMV